MYLYVVDGEIHIGKNLSDAFPVQNGVKQGDALLPLLFNFRICHQESPRKSGRIGIECLVYADNNILGENTSSTKKSKDTVLEVSREVSLEVNTGKNKYMVMSRHQCRTKLQFTDS